MIQPRSAAPPAPSGSALAPAAGARDGAAAALLGILFAAYVALLGTYVVLGRHWTDEGWYLNAARLVAEGKRPYLDFAFTQAPGTPYVYALPQALFGPSFWVGRLTSLVFAIGTGWLTLYAARRLGGTWAAVWSFGFFALNLYTLHFLTVILTYPAATFCLAAALACLVLPWPAASRVGAALFFAALSTGLRFSAIIAFGGILLYGIWLLRRRPIGWAAFLPGLATLAAIFGPLWLIDPAATRFNLLGYHVRNATWIDTIWRSRLYWLNFIPGYLAWTLVGPLLIIAGWRRGWRPFRRADGDPILWLLALVVLATTVLHALPENPQAKYQTLIASWASALVGVALVRLAGRAGWTWAWRPWPVLALVALPFLAQVGGNAILWVYQGELSPRFSEIDVADGRLPISEIEAIGHFVRDGTPPGQPVITFFTSIAVAADRPVLPGLEMSIFSRAETEADADRFHLTTPTRLVAAIRAAEGSAVIVEQSLGGIIPESIILERYCLAGRFREIGQFREPVEVYFRRSDGRCAE